MKEAPRKKLPPKCGTTANQTTNGQQTTSASTPTKAGNDEILNTLLRINNFDSISRESLDIDLSACVTISTDPAAMMSGNSLSSTDFWRMLDESAQNPQLENTTGSDEGIASRDATPLTDDLSVGSSATSPSAAVNYYQAAIVKQEPQWNSFSGTFLRPEPPVSLSSLFSPLKKNHKAIPPTAAANTGMAEHPHPLLSYQRKLKVPTLAPLTFESKKTKISTIKVEPPEQLLMDVEPPSAASTGTHPLSPALPTMRNTSISNSVRQMISPKFGIFKLPSPTAACNSAASLLGAHVISGITVLHKPAVLKPPGLKPLTMKTPRLPAGDKVKLLSATACLKNAMKLTTALAAGGQPSSATTTTTNTTTTTSNGSASGGSTPTTPSTGDVNTPTPATGVTAPPALPVYKCRDCDGSLLADAQEVSKHELAGHRLVYACSVCEREFEQEAGLKKHLKTHRPVETRKDVWKKCPDCGKCLKLGSMWMHRKIHSDNKKYGCDICGQKFVQKINLTHHSRVHTAEKPFECPECQKRFQERSHLQRHQKYHAQTRSYRCEKCGKMYKTERCLKVHNLVHLEQRPFACTVCDKSFISNSKLKQHSNIHTGERPFKCNYCPRDFTNFPNWLKHTRRRHKVDHKTGEHLENIPSYCSKKSTKTSKEKAAAAAGAAAVPFAVTASSSTPNMANDNTTTMTTMASNTVTVTTTAASTGASPASAINSNEAVEQSTTMPTVSHETKSSATAPTTPTTKRDLTAGKPTISTLPVNSAAPPLKTQTKRKKKVNTTPVDATAATTNGHPPGGFGAPGEAGGGGGDSGTTNAKLPSTGMSMPVANPNTPAALVDGSKLAKVKRERKQPAPKQVQKTTLPAMPPLLHLQRQPQQQHQLLPTHLTIIKKEPMESKAVATLHGGFNYSTASSATTTTAATTTTTMPTQMPCLRSVSPTHHPSASSSLVSSSALSDGGADISMMVQPNFPDLHCLSITSAEELIMEQALEMEECGLYDSAQCVPSSANMDNAISADTATAVSHFKIKHEFSPHEQIIKEEECFGSLKDAKTRVLCSSLESSPFSSPASMELPSTMMTATNNAACGMIPVSCSGGGGNLTLSNGNSFFLTGAPFTLDNGTTQLFAAHSNATTSAATSLVTTASGTTTTTASTLTTSDILTAHCSLAQAQLLDQATANAATTQTLLSQYLPMTMGMPSLLSSMPTNQMLPSVDTLLFSAAAAHNAATVSLSGSGSNGVTSSSSTFFNGGKATAQHNLT